MNTINKFITLWNAIKSRLNAAGTFMPQLFLRLIIFWEFWVAGKIKYDTISAGGEDLQNTVDWFAGLNFPFPFDQISASANYQISMVAEILFGVLILFGLFTRFAAFSLIIVTIVATAAVHWPQDWNTLSELWKGYAISNKGFGNYKLPLLYIIMLIPLLLNGAGKFSVDNLLSKSLLKYRSVQQTSDLGMWGLICITVGAPLIFVMPYLGGSFAIIGAVLVAINTVKKIG